MRIRLSPALLPAALIMFAVAGPVLAQGEYPSRPIRFVVPFPPGGATDFVTRLYAEQMQQSVGRPFAVENRGGAGGNVGATEVARATPDGYTILMGSPGPNAINQFLYSKMPFPPDAFAPVVLAARYPNVLAVHPSMGVRTTQQLIDRLRGAPGKASYASAGNGSSGHLSFELFRAMTKLEVGHVPYKGTGPAIQDVVAGNVHMIIDNVTPLLPQIKAGRVLALGVTSTTRSGVLPDVPTVGSTVAGYEAGSWTGIFAPAGTPPAIIARLNEAANRALAGKEMRDRMASVGAELGGGTVASFATFVADEVRKWKAVVELSGAKVD